MTDPMELVGRATEASDLRDRIMNPNVAKSEAEWWASREIERLEACIREMVERRIRDDRKVEFRDFLIALFEEWGEEDWDEAAKQMVTFLTDDEGIEEYRDAYGLPPPPAPGAEA